MRKLSKKRFTELTEVVMDRVSIGLPSDVKIDVRQVPGNALVPRDNAECIKIADGEYAINILDEESYVAAYELLVHEISHVMHYEALASAGKPDESEDDHGDEWGVFYAKAYRLGYQVQ